MEAAIRVDSPAATGPQVGRTASRDSSRVTPPSPRGGRLCERRELLGSLDDSLQTRLTLIIAPAGYGKTTLLAQWCERLAEQQFTVAYYSASERDRDPAVFLAMIATALGQAGVDMGERSAACEGMIRDDLTLEDVLLRLELAGQPLVLIIDDFERVNESAIAEILGTFIDLAPPTVHLLVASRTFPAIPLSTLQIEGKLRLIDAHQLKLRREELAWMLELDTGSAELDEIARRTEGWPVTAELYRLWRQRHGVYDPRATFGGHVAEMHNYLAEQLFSSLPTEQFDLLVDIADRDEVSAELVDSMRGRNDSASLLAAAAHAISSLMWTGHENNEPVYRLHPLLLDHLRESLALDVARRTQLSINAAHWFLRRMRYPEAVRTALEAREEATVDQVIKALRPIHILVAEGASGLRLILRELPDEIIARHPRLQIMVALAHFKAGMFAESRAMLKRIRGSTQDFTIDPDGHPDWLAIEGNLTDLIATCQVSRCSGEVEALRDTVMKSAADDPMVWGAGEVVMMLTWQVRGDLDAAEAAIQRARNIYSNVELSRYSHTQIIGHEVLVLTARGRLRRVAELIASYNREPGFEAPNDASTPTLLRLMLAVIRYEREFSETSVEAVKNSFAEHSKAESWFDQYAIAYPIILMRLFVRAGTDGAIAYIHEARARALRTGLEALPDFLTFLEIECRARGRDLAGAERLAEAVMLEACVHRSDPLAERRGWRERDAAATALVRLRFAQAQPRDVLTVAQEFAKAGEAGGRLRTEIKGLVFGALALALLGRPAAAEADLLKAVMLAYPEGFVAPFVEEGAVLEPLITGLLADHGIDGYARRHLETIARSIGSAMAHTDTDQLNARELETVRHLAEGLSNKVIARRMGITDHTVKFHLKKIFSKLEVSSRRAAVAKVLASEADG